MIRAFVAIGLPETVCDDLVRLQAMLPVPRPVPRENLHLTLVFLGDVEDPMLEKIHHALDALRAEPFPLTVEGVGLFGGGRPRLVHAGVSESAPLRHLQSRVARAARNVGATVERRRFTPHVTLAYTDPARIDRPRLERAVAASAGFRAGPFPVTSFALFRSDLGQGPARHTELARYKLLP